MPITEERLTQIRQLVRTRDAALRQEIILSHVPLVHHVLGRLGISQRVGIDYEDAASQGLMGLIEAVDRYDPSYGAQLSTFATVKIRGKVLDYLRSSDWLSRGARKRVRQVQQGIAEFLSQHGRTPSEEELVHQLGLNLAQVQQGLIDTSLVFVSLDGITGETDEDTDTLHEFFADERQPEPSSQLEQSELRTALAQAIASLAPREQQLLSLYYIDGLTFKEIAAVLNISESWVCQLHGRLLSYLHSSLEQAPQPA